MVITNYYLQRYDSIEKRLTIGKGLLQLHLTKILFSLGEWN